MKFEIEIEIKEESLQRAVTEFIMENLSDFVRIYYGVKKDDE